jgi:hypothetical protein
VTASKAHSELTSSHGDEYLDGRGGSSKIVDGVDIFGPCFALSYRWGSHPTQGYITTKANLSARKLHILESDLPKTFRHAIYVTRRLGLRYLWIDTVCIIQDCTSDWLVESGKMGSIFASSLLTLFAAGSKGSEEGIFNRRSTFGAKGGNQRITIQTSLPDRAVRSTLYLLPVVNGFDNLNFRPYRQNGPLLSRAWCLQEELLSKRKLYYASDQLYWECDHLVRAQDNLIDPHRSSGFPALPSFDNITESGPAWKASLFWYHYVISSDYSRRVATKATDRLVAVAGLARHVANTVKSRYIAGLWEVSVLQGLLWEKRVPGKAAKTHCAPSWSWASQGAYTMWYSIGHEDFVPGFEYLEADIELLSSDVYGGVISGTLTLRSKVVEVVVKEQSEIWSASCEGVRGWVLLDEETSLSDASILAVPVLDDVSLVVTKNSGSHTYRRVGLWRVASNIEYSNFRPSLETWDVPAEYLRWRDEILPTIPVTEITIE